MNQIIYIVGLIVIVVVILGFFGLRWPRDARSGLTARPCTARIDAPAPYRPQDVSPGTFRGT